MSARRRPLGLGGRPLGADSPLLGGPPAAASEATENEATPASMERRERERDEREALTVSDLDPPASGPPLERLRELLPAAEPDHGLERSERSERLISALDPLLNFYYRYWFRVEAEGIGNVPAEGGALLVGNHSGALPPDAPMIMQAIRNEHPSPRPLYLLGDHWFEGFPAVAGLARRLGVVTADPGETRELIGKRGNLALVFPEGARGTRKVLWQRYRVRHFGRGGFVRAALLAGAPIVPVALVGGEEAMPIFAHLRPLRRITDRLYGPLSQAFPHLGPAAALAYLPAKFQIRFMEPIDASSLRERAAAGDAAAESIAEGIRVRIQQALDEMLARRRSVWLG